MVFVLETEQAILWFVTVVFNFFGLLYYPMVALAWRIEFFWLLFVNPNPSSAFSEKKRGRSENQHRKSVPRYIRQISLSKNKFPIYAYAAQINIFTSYRIIGWYAFVLDGQICDDDGVDSLGVMTKISWHTHLIFYSIRLCCENTSQTPWYITFGGSWFLLSYIIIRNLIETTLF